MIFESIFFSIKTYSRIHPRKRNTAHFPVRRTVSVFFAFLSHNLDLDHLHPVLQKIFWGSGVEVYVVAIVPDRIEVSAEHAAQFWMTEYTDIIGGTASVDPHIGKGIGQMEHGLGDVQQSCTAGLA